MLQINELFSLLYPVILRKATQKGGTKGGRETKREERTSIFGHFSIAGIREGRKVTQKTPDSFKIIVNYLYGFL